MTTFTPPLADIRFALRSVGDLDAIGALPGLAHASAGTVDAVLEEAGRLAAEIIAPLNKVGDREGAVLEGGAVRTAPGFKEAYARLAGDGWVGATFPERWGGQDLPWVVGAALAEIWNGANLSLQLCPLLAQAAIETLVHHGSEAQQNSYLPQLVSGRWAGAMCLTEPQAGTDVGAVRTRAEPAGEGLFRLFGQKIYITYGDHDLTENIVHLVLARLPGAPEGTRGLSLFIVPKFLPRADGALGPRNDWSVLKLEHKLGIRASPTCVIAYGEGEGAVGDLLGEPHGGMRGMFTTMNNARLGVGHEGLGLAERAYQGALAYARERVQGRRGGRHVPIIEHPDVRRMLLVMRARIAAMRALSLYSAAQVDRAVRSEGAEARTRAAGRVALLTPIMKAWCTDAAQDIARDALQVYGGIGFIEETGAAQHYRDAMILSIYEGTNGVQAMDLVGRKLALEDGRVAADVLEELRRDLALTPAPLREGLGRALDAVTRSTEALRDLPGEAREGVAVPYLRLLAGTLGGFLLARGARAATAEAGQDWPSLAGVFVRHLLPPVVALEDVIVGGSGDLDPALLGAEGGLR